MNGFLVVRLPDMTRDPAGRGVFPAQAPCLDTICYGGIDRMPWFDIDEAFYRGTLPDHLKKARKLIKENNADFSGIELCREFDTGRMLLDYSNRLQPINELIVVRSEKLGEIKGTIDFDASNVTWIGHDIVSLGHWSLLREGLFASPSAFSEWKKDLNNFGLLSSSIFTAEYAQAYQTASLKGYVEELPENVYGIDAIEIGRIHEAHS